MERDYPVSSGHHYDDIKMAIDFVCSRVNDFTMPERVVPAFQITEQEIQFLEEKVRENLRKNLGRAGVDKDEEFEQIFAHAVRCGVNFMLKDENDPQLQCYRAEFHKKGGIHCEFLGPLKRRNGETPG